MALSYVLYTANGSTTQFDITFSYIDSSHVKVYLDNVEDTSFTFVNTSRIQTSTTPENGVIVKVDRDTPTTSRLVDFQDGSTLTETDLDKSANQNFFSVQENVDAIGDCLKLDNTGVYDAGSVRIINVANPTANQDSVTKYYLENTWLSSSDKTNITTLTGISGDITTVAGISANVTSVAGNASNINTVAGVSGNVTTVATDIANVNTVASDLNEGTSEIDTVATNIANVNTVGGISANVTTVAGIASNVTSVASDATDIGTVATNIANVNTVAGNNSNITSVAGNATNINTVAGNNSNITTVAGQNSNITTLAGISSDITAAANISSDIQDVQDKLTEIEAVADDLAEASSEIDLVAGSIANVDLVGGSIANVNTVGGSITNVNTVATNVAAVNSFANTYRIASSAPASSLDVGDVYFDTTADTLKVYSSSGWQNAGSSVNGTSQRYKYIATSNQTTFTGSDSASNTLAYDSGYIDVYLNGVHLDPSDYTASNGTSVVLGAGAATGDILYIVGFGTFSVADMNADNLSSGTIPVARYGSTVVQNTWESKSNDFTAAAGKSYFCDTSSNDIDVTLPSGTIGDEIRFLDVSGTFDTNDLTILYGSSKIQGASANLDVSTERAGFALVYYNATQGWLLKDK